MAARVSEPGLSYLCRASTRSKKLRSAKMSVVEHAPGRQLMPDQLPQETLHSKYTKLGIIGSGRLMVRESGTLRTSSAACDGPLAAGAKFGLVVVHF